MAVIGGNSIVSTVPQVNATAIAGSEFDFNSMDPTTIANNTIKGFALAGNTGWRYG